MKKIILLLFLAVGCVQSSYSSGLSSSYPCAQNFSDTTQLPIIMAINLNSYIGKPVDSLFAVLPGAFTARGFIPVRGGNSIGVYQSYGTDEFNNCGVQIFIDNFQFMTWPNRSPASTWDMNLAKRETISFIKVIRNNRCYYNCNNPSYPY